MQITCVVDARAELGESTLWDPEAQVLWWIDIWGPTSSTATTRPPAATTPGPPRNTSAASASAPRAA